MPDIRFAQTGGFRSLVVFGVFLWLSLVVVGRGRQANPEQPPDVKILIEQLRNEPVSGVTVNRLADAGATEAISVLREKFALNPAQLSADVLPSEDLIAKSLIASALVRLGERSEEYWTFLVNQASIAVESDAPFPLVIDSAGRIVPKQLSPEFLSWAKNRPASPDILARDQVYGMQVRITALAMTGDSRGLPVLRKALASKNPYIQYRAAQGLALLSDKESIQPIIEACLKAPADFAPVIAQALVFFDNSAASQVAERFIQPALLELLREKSRKEGPRGMFR